MLRKVTYDKYCNDLDVTAADDQLNSTDIVQLSTDIEQNSDVALKIEGKKSSNQVKYFVFISSLNPTWYFQIGEFTFQISAECLEIFREKVSDFPSVTERCFTIII